MYGGSSSKLNRPSSAAAGGASSRLSLGGGGGNQKRFHGGPPPPPPSSSSRAPGVPRDRKPGGRSTGGLGGGELEETFSLVSGKDAVAFASIIRLAPDLVEEIRRFEGQGGKARIKFDANASNSSGNVIEVGGREYRFTWSQEFGDLCDIYEERQRGINGNGLLVESGSAWRKINVQRVLDESTKKHVKMRSEEAEKKSKSRKAIVLEPGNPSMKSQIKQLAAVEVNPRRMHFLPKKESKQKVGPSSVSLNGASKPTFKPGPSLPAKSFAKGSNRLSASPLPSPSHRSNALVSPYKLESTSNRNMAADDATYSYPSSKDSAATFHRDPSKDFSGSHERPGHIGKYGDRPMNLQNSLIKLLKENPKGMSFKALENAISDTIPDASKRIEPILKKIATFQEASGAYLLNLKTGGELDSFRRTSPGSGSSPEENLNLEPASELNVVKSPLTDGRILEKIKVRGSLAESNLLPGADLDASESIDIERNSPDIFGDKKDSENSKGRAGSSSDSGSDSDNESRSSDSGSDSGSPSGSRSRSQAGSGSSSDSESDASSNSKQGSDVDVDIMTSDDEKVRKPLHTSDPGITSLAMGRSTHYLSMYDSADDHQDGHASDIVDIENEFVDTAPKVEENATEGRPGKVSEEFHRFSPDENELLKRQHFIGSLFDERETVLEESSKCERSSSNEKNLSKSGRGSEPRHTDVKSEMTKKLKAESHNHVTPGKSGSNSQQSGRRSSDKGLQGTHDSLGKNNRHPESMDYESKVEEKCSDLREGTRTQRENFGRDDFSDIITTEKVLKGTRKENGGKDLMSIVSEPVQVKHDELVGKLKEMGHKTSSLPGTYQKGHERNATAKGPSGRGAVLQREHSDLELGELREPVPEATAPSKQPERNPDSLKFDTSGGKPPGKAFLDPVKKPTSNMGAKAQSMPVSSRKRSLEQRDDNHTTLNQSVSHLESQRSSRVDSSEINLPIKKDLNKLTKNEAGNNLGLASEETGNNLQGPSVNGVQHSDPKMGLTSQFVKESRLQNCSNAAASVNGQKDLDLRASQKVRESSSDDSSCSYSKFEKDEPELKGRIKDFSQYKEYVQEYHDKYKSYCSLNKILENYRNQFQKIGNDLESARGRDSERYTKALAHLRDSYRQCGRRHKRLKKIFLVLHEELKHLKQMIKDFVATHSKDRKH